MESVAPPVKVRSNLLRIVRQLADLRGLKPVAHCIGIAGRLIVREHDRVTVVLRFSPGAVMPGHGHIGEEHSFVVSGSCRFGDRTLSKGDFHYVAPGTSHTDVVSDEGCVLLLTMDVHDYEAA